MSLYRTAILILTATSFINTAYGADYIPRGRGLARAAAATTLDPAEVASHQCFSRCIEKRDEEIEQCAITCSIPDAALVERAAKGGSTSGSSSGGSSGGGKSGSSSSGGKSGSKSGSKTPKPKDDSSSSGSSSGSGGSGSGTKSNTGAGGKTGAAGGVLLDNNVRMGGGIVLMLAILELL